MDYIRKYDIMVIMRVESGGGAGVALVDINGLINMS